MLKQFRVGKKYKFDKATKDLAKRALSKLEGQNHKHTEAIFAENELGKIEKDAKIETKAKKIVKEAEDNDDEEAIIAGNKILAKVGSKETKDLLKESEG